MYLLSHRKLMMQVLAIALALSLYDVLLHGVLFVFHYIFEWIELGLEELIEHLLHTNRKQTQLIVFYILLGCGALLCYQLWQVLTGYYKRLKKRVVDGYKHYQTAMQYYWLAQTSIQKWKLMVACTASFSFLVLFTFS